MGSALIDTVAERTIATPLLEIEEGIITYSIGGSSYNIAANLALEHASGGVGLFTYLPPQTTTSDVIIQRLRQLGVSTRYVRRRETVLNTTITAGGFVGIRDKENGTLHICAVEEVMGTLQFLTDSDEKTRFQRALKRARAIVVDTGLSPHTIAQVLLGAKDAKVPVFVHLVSPKKTVKYTEALQIAEETAKRKPDLICCVSGKRAEIAEVLRRRGLPPDQVEVFLSRYGPLASSAAIPNGLSARTICEVVNATHVVVTPRTTEDAFLLSRDMDSEHRIPLRLKAPRAGSVGNLLGVSEAVAAAVIYQFGLQDRRTRASQRIGTGVQRDAGATAWLRSLFRPLPLLNVTALPFVQRVVNSVGATPLAVISGRESYVNLPPLVRWRKRADVFWSLVTIGLVIWAIVSLVALAFFDVRIANPKLGF